MKIIILKGTKKEGATVVNGNYTKEPKRKKKQEKTRYKSFIEI